MLLSLPLLIFPVIAYNIIAFLAPLPQGWKTEVYTFTMVTDQQWTLTFSDLMVTGTLLLLFLEILKATRTGAGSILDHALSTVLFIVCLVEFLLVPQAGTSTYFLITLIALIDVVAGYSVTIRSARRDFTVGPQSGF